MKDKYIKQLFEKFKKELCKESVSGVKHLYFEFNEACCEFEKKLVKQAGKEQTPKILEAIDNIIETYIDCFFELAYAYYDEGYMKGFISAVRNSESE